MSRTQLLNQYPGHDAGTIKIESNRPARRRARGFTLLEIIVVVTIIALLAAMVAPKLLGNVGKAKERIASQEVQSLSNQVSVWMANNGYDRLPDDFDLDALTQGDGRVFNADDLVDPWDQSYVIIYPGDVNPDFDIISSGSDREFGTEDDVVN